MSRIIAGRFDKTVDADAALEALRREGFTREEVAGMVIAWLVARDYGALVVLFGAALGAYVGSFLGAMNKVRGGRAHEATREHPVEPRGGRMIAVCVDRSGMQARALKGGSVAAVATSATWCSAFTTRR